MRKLFLGRKSAKTAGGARRRLGLDSSGDIKNSHDGLRLSSTPREASGVEIRVSPSDQVVNASGQASSSRSFSFSSLPSFSVAGVAVTPGLVLCAMAIPALWLVGGYAGSLWSAHHAVVPSHVVASSRRDSAAVSVPVKKDQEPSHSVQSSSGSEDSAPDRSDRKPADNQIASVSVRDSSDQSKAVAPAPPVASSAVSQSLPETPSKEAVQSSSEAVASHSPSDPFRILEGRLPASSDLDMIGLSDSSGQ